VRDADLAAQAEHVLVGVEHVAHQPVVLAQVQLVAVARDDAGRVLAAVLQHRQRVVQLLVDRRVRDEADDAAHVRCLP
jgi:hypothetical protein